MEGRIDEYLEKKNISAIFDLDTRAITRKIRDGGVQNALITRTNPEGCKDELGPVFHYTTKMPENAIIPPDFL